MHPIPQRIAEVLTPHPTCCLDFDPRADNINFVRPDCSVCVYGFKICATYEIDGTPYLMTTSTHKHSDIKMSSPINPIDVSVR